MRRFTVAEALLAVGTVVFVVVAFLVLELQRGHQQRMERIMAAQVAAHDSPVKVIEAQPPAPLAPALAVTPRPAPAPPVRTRHKPAPHHGDELDLGDSRDPIEGLDR